MNAMTTANPIDKILKGVRPAITHFAGKVAKKCGMSWEDAEQELLIAAWLSITKHKNHPTYELKKWIMSSLCFQALHLIEKKQKSDMLEGQALLKVWPTIQKVSPDHAESIVQSIVIKQILRSLPSRARKIINMRTCGFTYREIGKQFDIGQAQVWGILNKVRNEQC